MKKILAVLLFLGLFATESHARNVSYVDGWTVLGEVSDDSVYNLVHYTPHRLFSVGYRYEYFREQKYHYQAAQVNYLAKRWNAHDAQANFYLLSDIGGAYSRSRSETSPAFSTGAAVDWENRRFFVSYENRVLYAGDVAKTFSQKTRVGFAPYVAEFGKVHTWLMAQVRYNTSSENLWTVTPLVRVFKGPVMLEAGWTIEGEVFVSWRILL